MKTSQFMVTLVLAGASVTAAACAVKTKSTGDAGTTSGSGGTTGVTGAATTGKGGGATSSVTSASMMTSSATGMQMGCDTGMKGTQNSPECIECAKCAIQGACMAAAAKCQDLGGMNPTTDCGKYGACRSDCIKKCDLNKDNFVKKDDKAEWDCYITCHGDPATKMGGACQTMFANGLKDYDAYVNCIDKECPLNCGKGYPICDSTFTSGNKTCGDCLGAKCCAEIKACGADTKCSGCFTSGNSNQQADCDAGTLDEGVQNCVKNKCAVECPSMGM